MQKTLRRRIAALATTVVTMTIIVPASPVAAQVSGSVTQAWADPLPSPSVSYQPHTHAGGGVSIVYADPSTRQLVIKTVGSNREQLSTTRPGGKTLVATGKNGDVYLVDQNQLTAQMSDGTVRWTATAPTTCSATRYINNVVSGSDGHVYALVTPSYNTSCSGAFQLIKLNAATGGVIFAQPLGNASPTYYKLSAYKNGLVVTQNQTVRHFNNNGSAGAQLTGPSTNIAVNANGRAIFAVTRPPNSGENCTGTMLDRVVMYDPNGAQTTTNLRECTSYINTYLLSNGGVLIYRFGSPDTLISIAANGTVAWRKTYPPVVGAASRMGYVNIKTDSNDNVVVMQQTNTSGRYSVDLQVLNASTGAQQAAYSTSALAANANFYLASPDGYQESMGLAPGRAYLALTKCVGSSCSAGLYALSLNGLTLDYPRGAVWGAHNGTPLKYVALGDSFSSGEGVPGFEPGTDTAGPPENRCHRSQNGAYAKWLDRDPAFNVELVKFAACSGAVTAHITQRWPNPGKNTSELAQIDHLSSATGLATITIGGNDIGFGDFATACVLQDCSGTAYETIKNRIRYELPHALQSAFSKVKERIGTQTRVLVIGYPMMMPKPEDAVSDCAYMSSMEKLVARDVIQQLNAAIEVAANAAKTTAPTRRFEYVNPNTGTSPFVGHELCRPGSYFNGLQLPLEYSLHPNAQGQNAYWQVIANHLSLS